MASAQYLQITFQFKGSNKIKELETIFSKALDWIRITPNVWILWTTSTPAQWYRRLKPILGSDDSMYIFGIDNNIRHGWGPKWVWEWLDKKR